MQAIPSLIGTSCAVGVSSAGFVFGQSIAEEQDRAHTSYIARSTSLAGYPRSRTPSAFRQNRPFSQDFEPSSVSSRVSGFSHLTVPTSEANNSSIQDLHAHSLLHSSSFHKSNQNLKHSASQRQIQHQSSIISNATVATNGSKNARPVSRRYTLSRQIGFRRSPQPFGDASQNNSRSHTPVIDEGCGDSVSSSGSWIRKLSRRPISQHGGSSRSHSALDSHPSLSQPAVTPVIPPASGPNKLVKRPPSAQNNDISRSTFRRPATSHQRSATLQNLTSPTNPDFYSEPAQVREFSAFGATRPPVLARQTPRTRWNSFLHAQTVVVHIRSSSKITDSPFSTKRVVTAARRVFVGNGNTRTPAALIKPDQLAEGDFDMLSNPSAPPLFILEDRAMSPTPLDEPMASLSLQPQSLSTSEASGSSPVEIEPPLASPSSVRTRRSLSFTLSSASSWIARNSSLRRSKRRGSDAKPPSTSERLSRASSPSGRNNQFPVATLDTIEASILCDPEQEDEANVLIGNTDVRNNFVHEDIEERTEETTEGYSMQAQPEHDDMQEVTELDFDKTEMSIAPDGSRIPSNRSRNLSKFPMPPSFAPMRIGVAIASVRDAVQPAQSWQRRPSVTADRSPMSLSGRVGTALTPAPTVTVSSASAGSRTSSGASQPSHEFRYRERSSTVASSEMDGPEFASADDDTDFHSDAMYDSVRTHGSVPVRAVETPLESIFNDSPPSTTFALKNKRPSILDHHDPAWDAPSFMRAQDEDNLPTPIPIGIQARMSLGNSSYDHRLSLDDDFEDDWGEMDTSMAHGGLSPPSVQGSMNMHSISANMRKALASMNKANNIADVSGIQESEYDETIHRDRPLSNLFDWTEPSVHIDGELEPFRPRTVHGKQDVDSRGGRASIRRLPAPAHIRSQSVPVVNDNSESTSPMTSPKFGTWGLGTKTASEDWGEDFEFGDEQTTAEPNHAGDSELRSSFIMLVPASIQASQPSLKIHSGQIRELSLLVNDLKRLCRHGRELKITDNHKTLWEEADGIIALASPDEEELEGSVDVSSSPAPGDVSDHFMDDSFSEADLDGFDISEHEVSVIRHRGAPRRSSVLLPEDDCFGGSSGGSSPAAVIPEINWPLVEEPIAEASSALSTPAPSSPIAFPTLSVRNPSPSPRLSPNDTGAVRSVAAAVHHTTTPNSAGRGHDGKFHFDTTSLKTLVRQACSLRDSLAEVLREADPAAAAAGKIVPLSPAKRAVARNRERGGMPAFAQMFNEPVGTGVPPVPSVVASAVSPGRVRAPSRLGREVTVDGEEGIRRGAALMTVT